MSLTLSVAPTTEPVTSDEMKSHLYVSGTDHDTYIASLIKAARSAIESETNRALMTQDWVLTLDRFPSGVIELPYPPIQSIQEIAYTDSNGDAQTLDAANYQLDTAAEPGRLAPARLCSWPTTDGETLGAVSITYRAGWTSADDIPPELLQAIKLLAGHWFENREEVVVGTTASQLPFAVRAIVNHWIVP